MTFSAQRIALLGLGLIAGSLGKALRAGGWQGELVGWGPREQSLRRGVELGVIDRFSLDLDAAIAGADVVVIGAPPIATGELLGMLLPRLATVDSQPIVTDLASIKGWVIEQAAHSYSRFVPGHPIAGSEHSGVAASVATLFAGREVILTPEAETDATAMQQVSAMWQLTGARVTTMSVADHDAALAASSHSPHMVAYALTMALSNDPLTPMKHGGGALRDMTRIAGSDPVMWRDIALTNRDAVVEAMSAVERELAEVKALIAAGDGDAMHEYFARCRDVRRSHDAVLNPLFTNFETDPSTVVNNQTKE